MAYHKIYMTDELLLLASVIMWVLSYAYAFGKALDAKRREMDLYQDAEALAKVKRGAASLEYLTADYRSR